MSHDGRLRNHVLPDVPKPHPLQRLARDYEPLSTWIGLFGNTFFLVGSTLFLWEATQTFATWLFILGSAGMLIDSIAGALRRSMGKPN